MVSIVILRRIVAVVVVKSSSEEYRYSVIGGRGTHNGRDFGRHGERLVQNDNGGIDDGEKKNKKRQGRKLERKEEGKDQNMNNFQKGRKIRKQTNEERTKGRKNGRRSDVRSRNAAALLQAKPKEQKRSKRRKNYPCFDCTNSPPRPTATQWLLEYRQIF